MQDPVSNTVGGSFNFDFWDWIEHFQTQASLYKFIGSLYLENLKENITKDRDWLQSINLIFPLIAAYLITLALHFAIKERKSA